MNINLNISVKVNDALRDAVCQELRHQMDYPGIPGSAWDYYREAIINAENGIFNNCFCEVLEKLLMSDAGFNHHSPGSDFENYSPDNADLIKSVAEARRFLGLHKNNAGRYTPDGANIVQELDSRMLQWVYFTTIEGKPATIEELEERIDRTAIERPKTAPAPSQDTDATNKFPDSPASTASNNEQTDEEDYW